MPELLWKPALRIITVLFLSAGDWNAYRSHKSSRWSPSGAPRLSPVKWFDMLSPVSSCADYLGNSSAPKGIKRSRWRGRSLSRRSDRPVVQTHAVVYFGSNPTAVSTPRGRVPIERRRRRSPHGRRTGTTGEWPPAPRRSPPDSSGPGLPECEVLSKLMIVSC